MKKLLSLAVVLSIVLLSITVVNITPGLSADAADDESLFNTLTTRQIIEINPTVSKEMKTQLENMNEDILMSTRYKVPDTYIEELFVSILCENPEMFYVDPHTVDVSVDVSADNPDGTLVALRPTYLFTKEEASLKKQELESAANAVIQGIESGWSTMQKCRYVHDMIALNCSYYSKSEAASDYSVYTAYGALVNGEAYCEGYALAYNYIMKKLGISAAYIQSTQVKHAWSLVNIDGDNYHVDIAYDDPIPDTAGRVFHDFCIVSDGQMNAYDNDPDNEFKHTGWVSSLKAENDKYNLDWWRGVETAIFTIGDRDYYINHSYGPSEYGALLAYNNEEKQISEINKIENRWYVEGKTDTYWQGNFSYLAYDGEYLYYNDTTNVYRLSPGSTQRELYYLKPSSVSHYIYGFAIFLDKKMYISAKATPNDNDILHEINYNVIVPNPDSTNPDPTGDTASTEETLPTGATTVITIIPPAEIPVSKYTRTLEVGKTYTMSVMDSDPEASASYSTTDPSIVIVSSKGKVTALRKGVATVTITLRKKGVVAGKVKCKVKIKKDPSLSRKSVSVKRKGTVSVRLKGKVSSIKNKYTNTSRAKIISKTNAKVLKIRGLKKGKTTLKVRVNGVKTLKLAVTVK